VLPVGELLGGGPGGEQSELVADAGPSSTPASVYSGPMSSGAHTGRTSMLIIAGYLVVDAEDRDAFVAEGVQAVAMARSAPGCLDFSITADTLDPRRVNIFERWETEEELLAFRGAGPDAGTAARILDADVQRYVIASVGAP
jgi:quinol monooxygenase YgiN